MKGPWIRNLLVQKLNKLNRKFSNKHYSNATCTNFSITTPIFYVNSGPHIGHLYSAVLADAIARYNSMLGHSVWLSAGTDEYGNKVLQAAKASKLSTNEYCSQVSKQFKNMCQDFDVEYSDYIRTTEARHMKAVHNIWNMLEKNGHIYPGKYSGWYCIPDEAFLTSLQLKDKILSNGETIKVSIESGHPVEWAEENNYKFRLSSFRDDLKHWLRDGSADRKHSLKFMDQYFEKTIQPAKFHKILLGWIEEGTCLEDLSVSRPVDRVPWGVPVPTDKSQNIYVWLDALVNYISALGYPDESYKKFWPASVQVIGKDILKFHAVYWPSFLMGAGLEPPRRILCHSHWTVDSQKMSKSIGNVVSPFEAAKNYTADGLRYFLLREAVPHSDANYSATKVQNVINSELADTLGNLVSRCTGKIVNPDREVPHPAKYLDNLQSESANKVKSLLENLHIEARNNYEKYNLHHVVDSVMSALHAANQMVEYHKPWKLVKQTDGKSKNELKAVISLALESARISGLILYPIVPGLSNNLLNLLNVPQNERSWANTIPKFSCDTEVIVRNISNDNSILFERIRN